MNQNLTTRLRRLSLWIFYGLLAYMPLHIFLSTWLGTSFGMLEVARVFKDVVLVVGFGLAVVLSLGSPQLKKLLADKLTWLIVAYAILTVLLALVKPTDQDAEILGVVYNLRFLVFFLYGALLCGWFRPRHLLRRSVQLALVAGAVVVAFGLVQYFVLSNTALQHAGYTRANGVLPVFLIDEKPDLERVMSTLRDPNSLGSYLIIIGSLAAMVGLKTKDHRHQRLMIVFSAATLLCLWLTFSRSALIGFVAAMAVLAGLADQRVRRFVVRHRVRLAVLAVGGALVLAGGLWMVRNTYLVQNVILHADNSTVQEDPNQLRIKFAKESIDAVVAHPLGGGPGTAGLASIRNKVQGTLLNENYYLQIATEVGLPGIALFLAILLTIGLRLWRYQTQPIVLALLASFVGLALTNFLVHIWSNEAVAFTWWGLVAVALAAAEGKKRTKSA